jgi:hypothetical protein
MHIDIMLNESFKSRQIVFKANSFSMACSPSMACLMVMPVMMTKPAHLQELQNAQSWRTT